MPSRLLLLPLLPLLRLPSLRRLLRLLLLLLLLLLPSWALQAFSFSLGAEASLLQHQPSLHRPLGRPSSALALPHTWHTLWHPLQSHSQPKQHPLRTSEPNHPCLI